MQESITTYEQRKTPGTSGADFIEWWENRKRGDPRIASIVNESILQKMAEDEHAAESVGVLWGIQNVNHYAAIVLREKDISDRQRKFLPAEVLATCMDGRHAGCRWWGCSPDLPWRRSTDGVEADTSWDNTEFHKLIKAAIDSKTGRTALYFSCGHHGGKSGSGCAARKQEGDTPKQTYIRACNYVKEQAATNHSMPSTA
jgi:hypothetical protein